MKQVILKLTVSLPDKYCERLPMGLTNEQYGEQILDDLCDRYSDVNCNSVELILNENE